ARLGRLPTTRRWLVADAPPRRCYVRWHDATGTWIGRPRRGLQSCRCRTDLLPLSVRPLRDAVHRSVNGLLVCVKGGFASRSSRRAASLACSYPLNGPSRRIGPLASRSITP